MTPTHAGVLQITRESLSMFRSAITDLRQEALDWKPLPTANSATVLVAHAVSASRFFLRAGSGDVGSFSEYRATSRADAFRTAGLTKDALLDMLTAFAAEAGTIVAAGTEEHLKAAVSMLSNDNFTVPERNGAGTLFAAIGHLREHLGHLQLMHDLWLAEHPNA